MFRKFSLLKALMLLLPVAVYSQQVDGPEGIVGQTSNPVVTAVPFLTIAPDARSAALGDAGVALSPDANASYWNPSKLIFNKEDMGASVSYTPWLQKIVGDMNLAYVTGYKKLNKRHALGLSVRFFDLGSIQFTDNTSAVIGNFSPREYTIVGTHSMLLSDRFSIGYNIRFIHSNLAGSVSSSGGGLNDASPASTASTDLSVFYTNDELTLGGLPTTFSWGVNLSNVGFKISYTDTESEDFIPTNLRLGTALTSEIDPYNKLTFLFDINKLMVPTPPIRNADGDIIEGEDPDRSLISGMFGSFTDAPDGFSEELQEFMFSTGLEYWYNDLFAARVGYFHEHQDKGNRQYYTLGMGFRYQRIGIDFAYLLSTERQHPLEDTLRFSLLFNFGSSGEEAQAIPQESDIGI